MASCDLDLHQVNKPIAAAARDGYASHAGREVKLHRRLCSPTTSSTTTTTSNSSSIIIILLILLSMPNSILDDPTRLSEPTSKTISTIRSELTPTPSITPTTQFRSISPRSSAVAIITIAVVSVFYWSSIRPHWRLTQIKFRPPYHWFQYKILFWYLGFEQIFIPMDQRDCFHTQEAPHRERMGETGEERENKKW